MTDQHETPARLCILHLEDSEQDHWLVQRELGKLHETVHLLRVETLDAFAEALHGQVFQLILADYRLAGFTALDAWSLVKKSGVRLPFVLLSGAIGETAAVEAIKAGIADYLPKSDLGKLRHVVQRAIEMHKVILSKEQADHELLQSENRLARLAEHLQDTIEQERAAIAREIHDDIGGSLAAIRFDLSWIARHHPDEQTQSHVASATAMLQHAIQASQRIMRNLRPAILDQGLAAALGWLVEDFTRRTQLEASLSSPTRLEHLSKPVQLVAYRTAQEALTNISKHAQCSKVKVDVSGDEQVLTLEVTDNGIGASATDLAKTQSFGLRGLKERAKTVGGWLDVSSRAGSGMSITLTIPLTDIKDPRQEHQADDQGNFV